MNDCVTWWMVLIMIVSFEIGKYLSKLIFGDNK